MVGSSGSDLSELARRLLLVAYRATTNQGRIFRFDSTHNTRILTGQLDVQGLDWRAALDQLERQRLIWRKYDTLYELTELGIQEAALLSASRPHPEPQER
ncbi:MAG TPA: hypothetical protein VEP50_19240 [bacterium]|nr:hypothetical protein [bacterium]